MYLFCFFFLSKKYPRTGWLIFFIANFIIVPRPWDFTGWAHYRQHYMGSILCLSLHFLAALKELKMSRPSTADRTISAKLCRHSPWRCVIQLSNQTTCSKASRGGWRHLAILGGDPAQATDNSSPAAQATQAERPPLESPSYPPHPSSSSPAFNANLFVCYFVSCVCVCVCV